VTRPATAAAMARARAYVAILRPDHWFKNGFMLLGVLLVLFYHPETLGAPMLWRVATGFCAACLVASSNYVINEILDAPTDRHHFAKRHRPIPSGLVYLPAAYAEWIGVGLLGLFVASRLNWSFFFTALLLLVMGVIYNVPPIRSKEHAYIDVLSESVNNPIRLALGWFAVIRSEIPPVSLLVAYWMAGAFFMACKRFAEYRSIGDPTAAAAYRTSFKHYDEERLLISILFYATSLALFLGVFIIRYHLELILIFPFVAGFLCHYLHVAFKKDSACQNPEHLYREKGLMLSLSVSVVAFVLLMFVHIPWLYTLFSVAPSRVLPLWSF
jgi:decaprenyl-phosphate phosphoribosyltransferase